MSSKKCSSFNTLGPEQPIGQGNNSYTLGPLQVGPVCCDPQSLIQVENFSLCYGVQIALDNITLDIYRGCITALIGPSNYGKTSFLSWINRLTDLIPGCHIAGRIRVLAATFIMLPAMCRCYDGRSAWCSRNQHCFHSRSIVTSNYRCASMASRAEPVGWSAAAALHRSRAGIGSTDSIDE